MISATDSSNINEKNPVIEYIEIDGQRIRYEVSGDGKPLILMHGWGCSLETVRSIAVTASRTNKVYNIDLPGFGESDEPSTPWNINAYTSLIEKFVKALSITSPILIGHSFGGRIALLFASRNDVSGVVLVDSAGIKPSHPIKYYWRVYSFKLAKYLIKTVLPEKRAALLIERLRSRRGSADYNNASPLMKSILSIVVNEDLKHVMPDIKAPTLLIWGKNDTATPLSDAQIMKRLISDSGLVVFENAGHYSFLDEPGRFAAVLASFLNSQK